MTIQQCKYVLAIAKAGSFNEAAKRLFVAQSSLSGSVKDLESELGIIIFERTGNGVFLTDDGAEFVRYAAQLAEQNDFILERYSTEKNSHKLYVSTQHYDFIADICRRMISEIKEENYRFSLRETKTYEVIHEIETAYSDIGILAIKDSDDGIMKRFLDKRGLFFTPVIKAYPHVFVRKEHPLAGNKRIEYGALKDYPYVSYEQGEHNISFFTEEIMNGFSKRHIEISDRASLMNVLLNTDCYTIGTGIMPSALNNGNIVSIPLVSDEFYMIGYILRKDGKLSDMAEEFIRLLIEETKDMGSRESVVC